MSSMPSRELLPRVSRLRARVQASPALVQDEEIGQLLRAAMDHLKQNLEREDAAPAAVSTTGRRQHTPAGGRLRRRVLSE